MAYLNSEKLIAIIAASIIVIGFCAVVLRRRSKRKVGKVAKDTVETVQGVNFKPIVKKSKEELASRLPQRQPKLPDYAFKLPADFLVQKVAERMVLMLEPYEELKEYRDSLQQLADDAAKPLLLAVMGLFKSGKSSFINELIGMKDFLRTDDVPATAVVTMLSYGETREVIAHLLDGTTQMYPYEKLHSLSAEGDEDIRKLRDSIDYIEVRIPVALLRKVTIVDTPGLNSNNEHHTRATERFANRADQVLWLFSYGQAGSRLEMSKLGQMANEWRPIGVVNCIDEHDPEEGQLDTFLRQVQRRLGNSVCRLEAVSTLQATEGRLSGDTNLFNRSGWLQLEKALQEELYDKAAMKKGVRLLSRLRDVITKLQNNVIEQNGKYEQAFMLINDKKKSIQTLADNRKKVQQLLNSFSGLDVDSALHNLQSYYPLPGLVSDYMKLNKQMDMMIGVLDELEKEHDDIKRSFSHNDQRINHHNIAHRQLEEEFNVYNKSGMFGGRPLLDWEGNLKVLNARLAQMEITADELNARNKELISKQNLFLVRLKRNEQEGFELSQLILSKLEESLVEFDRLLNNQEETQAEAALLQKQLYWTTGAKMMTSSMIGWELGAFGAAFNRAITHVSDGVIPATLENALSYLQQLEQQMLSDINVPEISSSAQVAEPALSANMDLVAAIAEAEEHSELRLEGASYLLSETLVLDKTLRLRGADNGSTVIAGRLDSLLRLTAMKELHVEGIRFELFGTVGNIAVIESGRVSFMRCEFTDVSAPQEPLDSDSSGAALLLKGNSSGVVDSCQFINNAVGIAAVDSSKLEIRCSLFRNQGLSGIIATDHAAVKLYDSELTHNIMGIYMDDNSIGDFQNNRIWFNNNGLIGAGESELTIENNEIVRNEQTGIRGQDKAFLTVVGNLCQANVDGIHIMESSGGYFAANHCNRNLSKGISYETKSKLVLERNTCTLNGEAGIAQYAAGEAEVTSNECSGNLMHGIYVEGSNSIALESNICNNNYDTGISLQGTVNGTLRSNTCQSNPFGIFVKEQAQAALINNSCSHNEYGGIYAGGQSKITATGCECNSNKTGIAVSNDANGSIAQCTTVSNQFAGIAFGERATGKAEFNFCNNNGEAGLTAIEQTRVELHSNNSKENKLFGILYSDDAKGIITENQCSFNEFGVVIMGKSTPIVKQNQCFNNEQHGIVYEGRALGSASSNNCYNNGMNGIYVSGESTPVLEKNSASGNSNSGIAVDANSNPTISFNILNKNRGYGIQIDDSATPKLRGNTYQGNQCGEVSK
ncbi:right-handed parallel beta-helix repeat-containing protein [Paenibacillus wynnii]|uniref:right-handed parallel beta-helix repeat-containing protein n=1 Tax=Paenibacillus wynnii TaxID=268407 RepID=UPI002792D1ED|nr:right-handed parallel beta-helix repeat-containing protein [Paenibacillus wynnii]MDQ0193536.1 parallel beta-helix repeat protein [Paenibacillus wynnii]